MILVSNYTHVTSDFFILTRGEKARELKLMKTQRRVQLV